MYGFCALCQADRPFEQPPCECGLGAECPEWMCTQCGAALLVGGLGALGGLGASAAGENDAGDSQDDPEHLHAA